VDAPLTPRDAAVVRIFAVVALALSAVAFGFAVFGDNDEDAPPTPPPAQVAELCQRVNAVSLTAAKAFSELASHFAGEAAEAPLKDRGTIQVESDFYGRLLGRLVNATPDKMLQRRDIRDTGASSADLTRSDC